jgi:peptidoglycan/xylan/chitin deacetylase (PgdA/CDA1 family)
LILIALGFPVVEAFIAHAEQTSPAETSRSTAPVAKSEARQLHFGSQAILDACWSPEELRGSPEDRKITRMNAAMSRPVPERTLPKLALEALPAESQNSIRSVEPLQNLKLVALTFDLCEGNGEITGYDADIVNYLRGNKVKATFFANGKWMHSHPEKALQLMADPLFEIGNHGWSHRNFRTLDSQRIAEEVLWTQAQYEVLWEELEEKPCAKNAPLGEIYRIPRVLLTFRFPYGTCNRVALDFLARSGLPAIQWSVVTGDAAPKQTAGAISRVILEQTRPGSIIICHANGRGHAVGEALPLFISRLRQTGYEFVTISELLASGPVRAVSECYEIRPGDNLRYDRPSGGRKK